MLNYLPPALRHPFDFVVATVLADHLREVDLAFFFIPFFCWQQMGVRRAAFETEFKYIFLITPT